MSNVEINLKVQVKRVWLIDVLKQNREKHRGIFLQAIEKYRVACIKYFEEQISLIKDGNNPDHYLRLEQPSCHVEDYDLVISMLENSTEDALTIGSDDYKSFVKDEWSWSRMWKTANTTYGISD